MRHNPLLTITLFALLRLCLTTVAYSADGESADAKSTLSAFLSLNAESRLLEPEARQLLCGEAESNWQTNTLGPFERHIDKFQLISNTLAIGRVRYSDNIDTYDCYFYIEKRDEGWRIRSMRTLAMTELIRSVRNMPNEIKLLSPEDKEQVIKELTVTGIEDQVRNATLTLSTDEQLRIWHRDNLASLKMVIELYTQLIPRKQIVYAYSTDTSDDRLPNLLTALGLSAIQSSNTGNIIITIGGISDNEVGFIYSPNLTPPQITDDEYIWIENIADEWYLYKTT